MLFIGRPVTPAVLRTSVLVDTTAWPSRSTVAPLLTVTNPLAPARAAELASCRIPAATVTLPVKVLLPARVRVSGPTLLQAVPATPFWIVPSIAMSPKPPMAVALAPPE